MQIKGAEATREALLRVHSESHLGVIDALAAAGGGHVDPDTYVAPHSPRVARETAGDLLACVDAVMRGEAQNAFAVGRPPGHHATPEAPMGFCLFSNVAIAARHAQAVHGARRVLVVDIDAHHGNGTEEPFYSDPTVGFSPATRTASIPEPAASQTPAKARDSARRSTCPSRPARPTRAWRAPTAACCPPSPRASSRISCCSRPATTRTASTRWAGSRCRSPA